MNIQLKVIGGTDKTIRFEFIIDGNSCGELQMGREIFTKVADKLFNNYYLIGNIEKLEKNDKQTNK